MRILLIEDEEAIAAVVRDSLEHLGYTVTHARDGREGLRTAEAGLFSLIILDVMLPGLDGLALCRQLREQRDRRPILMLTARDAVPDRVAGLDAGADDYLPKPFAFAELRARVQALLRRDRTRRARIIRVADLEIDTGLRRVTRAGDPVALTPREYSLLEALAGHEGRTLTREVILDCVWQDEDIQSNSVDVHVAALRRKIDGGRAVKLIQTVYGLGYRLEAAGGRPAEEGASL